MLKDKIKIIIIGCGVIADFHVNALQSIKDVQILGVYDANEEKCKVFAEKYAIDAFYSIEDVWNSDCDMVAICTPSGTHATLAISAMNAGKNVAVEKPLALNYEDCLKVVDMAEKNKKLCAPISQLRFSSSVLAVKKAVDNGLLGKMAIVDLSMKYFRSDAYYNGSWRGTFAMDGGGALMNQGIHGLDVMRFICGDVVEVQGVVKTIVHDIEVEDTAVANIVFKNGALGTVCGTTSIRPGYPRRMEICGSKGSIVMEEDTVLKADVDGFDFENSTSMAGGFSDPTAIASDGHKKQYLNIVSALKGETPLAYTSRDASETVKLITAIYESSKQGNPIKL